MRIIPTHGPDWEKRMVEALERVGYVCHPPGQSCVGAEHAFAGKQDTSYGASVYVLPRTGTLRQMILMELQVNGPSTDVELQEALKLHGNSERPRRVELVEGGFVRDSGLRRKHHGKEHIVWEAVR